MNPLFFTIFFISNSLLAQPTAQNDEQLPNEERYKISYSLNDIPSEFYDLVNIEEESIAVDEDSFVEGCTNPISKKRIKLNFVATHKKKNKLIISLTFGGKYLVTKQYHLKNKKGILKISKIINT